MIGNIAKTIEMISEKVDEPFINQQHLDELEQLRTHIDEETGIKATHEEGILHPVEIIESMQKVLTDDTTVTVDVEVTIFGWHVISEVTIQDIYYLVTVCKHLV